jgi:hypothetical protein
LCLMDCQQVDANDISRVIREGEIVSSSLDPRKGNCPNYILRGTNKKGLKMTIFITQCGNVSKVTNCYLTNVPATCNCDEKRMKPV